MNGVLSHYCTCLKGYLAIVVLGRTGAAPQAPGDAFVPIGKRVCVCVGVCVDTAFGTLYGQSTLSVFENFSALKSAPWGVQV